MPRSRRPASVMRNPGRPSDESPVSTPPRERRHLPRKIPRKDFHSSSMASSDENPAADDPGSPGPPRVAAASGLPTAAWYSAKSAKRMKVVDGTNEKAVLIQGMISAWDSSRAAQSSSRRSNNRDGLPSSPPRERAADSLRSSTLPSIHVPAPSDGARNAAPGSPSLRCTSPQRRRAWRARPIRASSESPRQRLQPVGERQEGRAGLLHEPRERLLVAPSQRDGRREAVHAVRGGDRRGPPDAPYWLESLTGLSLEARIGLALQALLLCGLVSYEGSSEPRSLRRLTGPGHGWREALRSAGNPPPAPLAEKRATRPGRLDFPEEDWAAREESQAEIMPWIRTAFSFVPSTTFIRFADFAEYQAAVGSPLAAATLGGPGQPGSSAAGFSSEEAMEELWKSFLGSSSAGVFFLSAAWRQDSHPTAARVSHDGRGPPVFSASPRRAFTRRRGRTATGRAAAGRAAGVQPNYEVVFLSPSPGLEAELGRFCERMAGTSGPVPESAASPCRGRARPASTRRR